MPYLRILCYVVSSIDMVIAAEPWDWTNAFRLQNESTSTHDPYIFKKRETLCLHWMLEPIARAIVR